MFKNVQAVGFVEGVDSFGYTCLTRISASRDYYFHSTVEHLV
jgi:hypothetical protein